MDENKEEKIRLLRGNLKNGRITQSSENLSTDNRDDDTASGATFQDARGAVERLTKNSRRSNTDAGKSGSDRRSTQEEPIRIGPADRRSGEDNGSTLASTADASTSTVGRFVADEPVRERVLEFNKPDGTFKREVENNPQLNEVQQKLSTKYPELNFILSTNPQITIENLSKELGVSVGTAHSVKSKWLDSVQSETATEEKAPLFKMPTLPKGQVLSKTEARELAEPFISALESDFEALDQYLWMRQKAAGIDTNEQPIWSDVDTEEIGKLTRVMLRWSQNNAAAATVVRGVVDSSDYIAVGTVFIPRIKQTVDVMRKTRRKPVRRGQENAG